MKSRLRKNKQIIFDEKNGDCMRASLTSMLGLPNDPKVVPLGGANEDFWTKCYKFLYQFGLTLTFEQKACWRNEYWMGSVKSKNFKGGSHSIVMKGSKVWHDPSTHKRYRAGESLLGKDVINGGHFLEVIDPSKLYKLELFRQKI